MITDNDLFAAVASAVREVEAGNISINIAVRDIRKAVKEFDAQPTIQVQAETVDLSKLA